MIEPDQLPLGGNCDSVGINLKELSFWSDNRITVFQGNLTHNWKIRPRRENNLMLMDELDSCYRKNNSQRRLAALVCTLLPLLSDSFRVVAGEDGVLMEVWRSWSCFCCSFHRTWRLVRLCTFQQRLKSNQTVQRVMNLALLPPLQKKVQLHSSNCETGSQEWWWKPPQGALLMGKDTHSLLKQQGLDLPLGSDHTIPA